MKTCLSILAVVMLFTAFACALESTVAATAGATSIQSVSAKPHHAKRHRPHKAAKHRRQRHPQTV